MDAEIKAALRLSTLPGQGKGNDRHYVPPVSQRIRLEASQPVGLQNIGNTCYFNSLLQIYYSMPRFVEQIFSFKDEQSFL